MSNKVILKRIRYDTMNSWNNSKAPAYNLKVYNVIPPTLRDKVYAMMDTEEFYDYINDLIIEFNVTHNYSWQAGMNGRSGGYLVLYRGGIKGDKPYSLPGRSIEDSEVPTDIKRGFEKLARSIVKQTIWLAQHSEVKNTAYTITKTRNVLEVY